jgi:hypothetical protein
MSATCKCAAGHLWSAQIVEDSPEINYFEVDPDQCPECGGVIEDILEITHDYFWDDAI